MTPSELKLASKYRAFEVYVQNMERGRGDLDMYPLRTAEQKSFMNGRLLLMALVMAVVGSLSASPSTAAPALPGQPCKEKPHPDWNEPERWAWTEICEGRIADFNARYEPLDPKAPEGWDDQRKLGQSFLETILLHDPFRSHIPRQGVRIAGAWFEDPIDLAYAKFPHVLWLDFSRFEASVDLTRIKTSASVSLEGSTFEGPVDMNKLQVESGLFMHGGASFKEDVFLIRAKVGGLLSMSGSTFEGPVNMDSLEVVSDLFMSEGARFQKDVILRGAKVGGGLVMSGSTFEGPVNMDSLEVVSALFMRGGASFKEDVILNSAKVGGQLSMIGSTFEGPVYMESLEVAKSLFMSADFRQSAHLIFAKIGTDLDLSGAQLHKLDLTGTRVGSELRLGSGARKTPEWADDGELILRNTRVGAIKDRWSRERKIDAWPDKLLLGGFTYERLGGLRGVGAEADMLDREVEWYFGWLERDETFTPQPYHHLAKHFRTAGQFEKADDILHAGRERERAMGFKWWGLTLLNATIGYGYGTRYFRALYWMIALVWLGVVVLGTSGQGLANKMPWGLSYSLDHLLPIIELRKYHYDQVQLSGWARYYFYLHKLMGYVLASFLIAGLAGLTQG